VAVTPGARVADSQHAKFFYCQVFVALLFASVLPQRSALVIQLFVALLFACVLMLSVRRLWKHQA
jgi:hypothetical protein